MSKKVLVRKPKAPVATEVAEAVVEPPVPPAAPVTALLAMISAQDLIREYRIGNHISKLKSLSATIEKLPAANTPYQIFLGPPVSANLNIAHDDLISAGQLVLKHNAQVYVHSPYIINLCNDDAENWHTNLLKKNLRYANTARLKGVVVHVGKSMKVPLPKAMDVMKKNVLACLEDATPECPLLLETPAGQGSETLKAQKEFVDFVVSLNDPRLRVCLDTCHVFACGHKPIEYIQTLLAHPGLLKLVHYNDSQTPCGSCKDRHAFVGTGHIGLDGMKAIAELCNKNSLPMVIE